MNNLKRTNIYNARYSIISSENQVTKLRDFVIIEIVRDFFRNLRILLLFPYFDKARSIFLRNRYGGERGGRERDETSETTKDQRGIREYGVSGGEGYSVGIGKMLFTQGRSELQKLCPYLHVVSLLRDQIPDRARNPDNSSFDPSPVGSSPVPAGPVCTGERVKTDESEEEGRERKKKRKKKRIYLAEEIPVARVKEIARLCFVDMNCGEKIDIFVIRIDQFFLKNFESTVLLETHSPNVN